MMPVAVKSDEKRQALDKNSFFMQKHMAKELY